MLGNKKRHVNGTKKRYKKELFPQKLKRITSQKRFAYKGLKEQADHFWEKRYLTGVKACWHTLFIAHM